MSLIENDMHQSFNKENIILQEVYFGKTKELIQAEKVIGEIRENYKSNQSKVNMSREIGEFNRLMEKAFKLEAFSLVIQYSGLYNACTLPIGIMIDAPNANNLGSEVNSGFNYNYCKGSSIIVYVNSGLMFDDQFTDGEVMGIIMHEIGHNFQSAISPVSRGFSYIDRAIILLTLPLQFLENPGYGMQLTKGTRKWYIDCFKKLREDNNGLLQMAYSFNFIISKIVGLVMTPIHLLLNITKILAGPTIPIPNYQTILSAIEGLPKFKDEALADNFATIYGYGPECNSALNKIKYSAGGWVDEKALRSIPLIGAWLDFCNLPTIMLLNIIDCHPNEAFRNKHQIDLLKRELNKSEIDHKMKAKIKSDISKLEKTLKDATDDSNEAYMFTNSWASFLLTICNGDIKGILASGNFDEFDAAYENNLAAIKQKRYGK